MRKLSNRWKEKVKNGMDVQYLKYADITLTDGTVLNLTSVNLWANGFSFEDSVSGDSSFDIGSAIINVLNLSINNFDGEYSDYDFEGAEVICYVGMEFDDGTTEKIRICTATVVEQPEDETVTIDLTCEDNIHKFDRNYSDSKLKYPATRGQIVRDACEVCGVTLQITSFDRDDYIVQNRPNDEALTFRQVLQWVAQIGCQWMRCDEYGRLCIGWYSSINEEELIIDDLGVLKTQDDSNISLELSSANGILSANNGTFLENDGILRLFATDEKGNVSEIKTTYGFTPHHTDVVITGVKVTEYSESSSDNPQTYMVGTEGYVLGISGNKLIRVGYGQTIASMIAEKCVGMRFRPFESECPTDVALEAGDSLIIVDRNGKIYTSLLTTTTLKPGSGQMIACNAKSAAKNSSTQYSQATQAFVTARNMVKQEKTEREKALEEFGKRIDSATGVYTTVKPQENGSKIFYLHDKPTLAESQVIWKMTSEAWGVSTDGGQTWNGGMTVDGDTIVRILTAVGLNADWINTGAITVKDKSGNIIFQVDMDTKTVVIDPDVLIIGNMTLSEKLENMDENIASAKNMTFQLSNDMQTITSDAAGNIPVFPTVTTTAKVMYGSSDITNDCSYTITKSDSVTGSWDVDTHTYTVTGLSADNGWVDIKATYLINLSVTKRFTLAKQKQGLEGDKGLPGKSPTIRYASMPDGSDMSDNPKYVKLLDSAGNVISDSTGDTIYTSGEAIYVGFLKADAEVDSTNPSDYEWSRYKGTDGLTQYTHLAYANSADGKTDFSVDSPNREYIGMYVDFTEADSTNPDDYAWSLIKGADGADGTPGKAGADGKTPYFHVAYANSEDGNTGFSVDDSANKLYIGQYTDYEVKDSTDPTKYSWTKIKGNDGPPGRTYYLRANTEILLMGQDKKVTPEKLTVNVYYRDGQGEETAYAGWWKAERSSDSGKTWTTITLNQTEATGACTITSSLQIIGSRGMIRVTCYLDQTKTSIADMQTYSVALDVASLTQTEIVKILSDDGKWNGLYYKNGKLYISFSAALGGELTLGGKNNGNGILQIYAANGNIMSKQSNGGQILYDEEGLVSGIIQYDKIFFLDTSVSLTTAEQEISGTVFSVNGISRYYGTIKESGTNLIFSSTIVTFEDDDGTVVDPPLWFDAVHKESLHGQFESISVKDASIEDSFFTKAPSVSQWEYTSASNTVCWGGELQEYRLMLKSSSSKRYKDIGNDISEQEIEEWYNIEPTWAKYKEGYLVEGDENEGRYIPMFIAEDVEEYFPEATRHANGQVEDWNERIMIPAMFAMIKSQKEQLDRQEKLINQLYEKLNIEKEN
jgi:hypothetical protein